MAKLTFTVTNIGGSGPGGSLPVNFSLDVEGEATGDKRRVADFPLYFPRDVGKEFEVDDSYPIEIQPKPESQH